MSVSDNFTVVTGQEDDPYRSRVEQVYEENPQLWQKVLGESLFFHHGVYEGTDTSLEDAAKKYLDAQLELAGLAENGTHRVNRLLDVGCGWGGVMKYLAERFPTCRRLDGINVSTQQLGHAKRLLVEAGLESRGYLFLCNAQDIPLLPEPE
ncbi:SAM-dependent methyltransferase, partial [Streptomyces heilongjiangensis]